MTPIGMLDFPTPEGAIHIEASRIEYVREKQTLDGKKQTSIWLKSGAEIVVEGQLGYAIASCYDHLVSVARLESAGRGD